MLIDNVNRHKIGYFPVGLGECMEGLKDKLINIITNKIQIQVCLYAVVVVVL
jgi:hypothetical protein